MGGSLSFFTIYYCCCCCWLACWCDLFLHEFTSSALLFLLLASAVFDTLRRLAPNMKRFANVPFLLVLLVRRILLLASAFIFSRSALSCSKALLPTKLFNIAIRFCRCSSCARCNCRSYGIAIPDAAASAIILCSVELPYVEFVVVGFVYFINYTLLFSELCVFDSFCVLSYKCVFIAVEDTGEVALGAFALLIDWEMFAKALSSCCRWCCCCYTVLVYLCPFTSRFSFTFFAYVLIEAVAVEVVVHGIFTPLIKGGLQRCVRRYETEWECGSTSCLRGIYDSGAAGWLTTYGRMFYNRYMFFSFCYYNYYDALICVLLLSVKWCDACVTGKLILFVYINGNVLLLVFVSLYASVASLTFLLALATFSSAFLIVLFGDNNGGHLTSLLVMTTFTWALFGVGVASLVISTLLAWLLFVSLSLLLLLLINYTFIWACCILYFAINYRKSFTKFSFIYGEADIFSCVLQKCFF